MSSELHDALVEAGASEEKARKAAEAVAGYESRSTRLETDMTVIKWSLGIGFSLVVSLLLLVLNWLWQVMQKIH